MQNNDDMALANALRGKRWYCFIFILLFLFITIGLTNYLIDPYIRYGTSILNKNRIDTSTWIVRQVKNQTQPPQLLLFGSSRVLNHRPNYHPDIHGANVSLYAGAIEDHYCILRYAVDQLKYPIKYVVLGLEADLMPKSHPISESLIRNKTLNRWLIQQPFTIQSFLGELSYIKELSSLLSIITLKDSCKMIAKYFLKNIALRDFLTTAFVGESETLSSTLPGKKMVLAKGSILARLRQYKTIYAGVSQVNPVRLKYLYKFAEFAKEKDILVILFRPGYSIEFWQEMSKINSFVRINREFDIYFEELKEQFGWHIIDFRPTYWKGTELDFKDGVHPTKRTNRIIDKAIKELINNVI